MEKLPEFDYYQALGVSNDATSTEIRTSYRKLILKCHPDKVQDASLRAIKQAEFQRVQEAYETISDEKKRLEYDELLQKIEIRRQMSHGKPTPWSNPFEYEIKTPGTPNVKVYMYKDTFNGSTEEVRFSRGTPEPSNPVNESRRSSKAESAKVEAQKKKAKEDEIRRLKAEIKRKQKEEEEKRKKKEEEAKQKQKEEAKRKLARKKEKERREKRTRNAYVDVYDGSDDEYHHTPRSSEKNPGQSKSRQEVPMNKKWTGHKDYAGAYVHASLKNSDTPNISSPSSSYGVRFTKSTENSPRESRDKKQSPATPIPAFGRKPSLKTQTSAPPIFRSTSSRRRPRECSAYANGTPSMPQAQTFSSPVNPSLAPAPDISSFSYLSISNQYPPGYNNSLNRSFSTGYYPADPTRVAFAAHTHTSSIDSTAHRASFNSYNASHNIKMVSVDNINYSPQYGYEHVKFASHSVHYANPGYS